MVMFWRRRKLYPWIVLLICTGLILRGFGLEDTASERSRQEARTGGSVAASRKKNKAVSLANLPVKRRLPTTIEHLMAGTIGGMSGVLVSYPLDTVRVRMQTSGKQFGPVRVASDLLGEAGVAGFYRGVASPVVGAALIKSFVFGGYGFCQSIVRRARGKDGEELTLWEMVTAATGAGFVSAFVVTPIERIKVVMQAAGEVRPPPTVSAAAGNALRGGVGAGGYPNAWACARGLVAERGLVRGLYAGFNPTMLREVPAYALYFFTYESLKRLLVREGDSTGASPGLVMLKTAVSGGIAGLAAWLPIYPIDVVKSRMQTAAVGGPGMLDTATQLWRTEGLRPFTRGLAPTLVRAVVNHASTFVVYEATISLLMRRDREAGQKPDEKQA